MRNKFNLGNIIYRTVLAGALAMLGNANCTLDSVTMSDLNSDISIVEEERIFQPKKCYVKAKDMWVRGNNGKTYPANEVVYFVGNLDKIVEEGEKFECCKVYNIKIVARKGR